MVPDFLSPGVRSYRGVLTWIVGGDNFHVWIMGRLTEARCLARVSTVTLNVAVKRSCEAYHCYYAHH